MERLVFGAGPVALSPQRESVRREFGNVLARVLGRPVRVLAVRSYDELGGLLVEGAADVAWLPPAVYVRAAPRGVTLLVSGVRQRSALYRGALFVRRDSPYQAIDEMRGTSVAWVDRNSSAGYLFPRLALRERGLDPARFFSSERELGDHGAVARAVAVGDVDVGATFIATADDDETRVLRAGWSLEVDYELMRPLLLTDPIPADTICAGPHVGRAMRDEVGAALAELHRDRAGRRVIMGLFGVERFEPTLPQRYEVVRRAAEG